MTKTAKTKKIDDVKSENKQSKKNKPLVGVIRWDAQSNNLVAPTKDNELPYVMSFEARILSYPQFYRRLPFLSRSLLKKPKVRPPDQGT